MPRFRIEQVFDATARIALVVVADTLDAAVVEAVVSNFQGARLVEARPFSRLHGIVSARPWVLLHGRKCVVGTRLTLTAPFVTPTGATLQPGDGAVVHASEVRHGEHALLIGYRRAAGIASAGTAVDEVVWVTVDQLEMVASVADSGSAPPT